jgi:hypothetical protein
MTATELLGELHRLQRKVDPSSPPHLNFLIVPGSFIHDIIQTVTEQYAVIESLKDDKAALLGALKPFAAISDWGHLADDETDDYTLPTESIRLARMMVRKYG